MIIRIGIAAGDIWHFLDKKGPSSLTDIVAGLQHPKDVVLMSIGWLAREGHIVLEKEEKDYKVMLRQEG